MIKFETKIESHSIGDTEKIGRDFGKYLLEKGEEDAFIAMYGDLGAGKTAFVRGLASSVVPNAAVCSPTYTIVNEYRGGGRILCHFDMYRIEDEDDLYSIGFFDYENCIMAVEWCEKIPFAIPEHHYKLTITKSGENSRLILIEEKQK
ncbi:MAG: tRNA (adenosine(37)-N6)-threonylcarbamoyltransferase complex ATPase subunit type 1 TsaE [Clostridia bacterium]|nr:tRNA (adenosine(37)-N6)-threonylcarbamoyltransferase complex ATPase subunit type 1 TsaE [Clostridia bacterium]